jgi:hypothetical protein
VYDFAVGVVGGHVGALEDDYVTVGVVSVEVVGVNALDNDNVAYVEGSVKRMTPTITSTIIRNTHTTTNNRQRRRNLRIQHQLRAKPEPKNHNHYCCNYEHGLEGFVFPEFTVQCLTSITLAPSEADKNGKKENWGFVASLNFFLA